MQRDKHKAANMIQKIVRGKQGRRRYNMFNFERVQARSAIRIQAIIRGFLARRTLHKILRNKAEAEAVLIIQARWRGAICRQNMGRMRKELMEYKFLRNRATTDIQRVFRGYVFILLYYCSSFLLFLFMMVFLCLSYPYITVCQPSLTPHDI
jgi:hypothetical protein